MGLVQKLDDVGKPAWIALMVVSFILFWPAGIAVLFYLIGSGRMRCWKRGHAGRWHMPEAEGARDTLRRWSGHGRYQTSGNVAFDEYREETLRRLEDEQKEFFEFLDRLRKSKDQAEFDQFMAERARRTPSAATDTAA